MFVQFPPEFVSGDGEGMDMQLPNHVYNNLKRHSSVANKRTHKLHEKKEHSTAVSYKNFQTPTILLMLIVLLSQSLHVFFVFHQLVFP